MLALGMVVLVGCRPSAGGTEKPKPSYGQPEVLIALDDSRVKESSGLAPSRLIPGSYYTINDSGNPPEIYRLEPRTGKVEAIPVPGAENVDWEDLATAAIDGRPYIFIGDIGDNTGRRASITVYRAPETVEGENLRIDQTYTLRYPDEPHNAETLMVHPNGDLYIVTKAATRPSMVFKLPPPAAGGEYVLQKVGEVQLGTELRESRLVTGGAVSPNGDRVVLRTYMSAYEFAAPKAFDDWVKAVPSPVRTNFDGQGEAITYALDGSGMLTSSEGRPCLISSIPSDP